MKFISAPIDEADRDKVPYPPKNDFKTLNLPLAAAGPQCYTVPVGVNSRYDTC
jgi:hypothetical protein